MTLKDLYVYVEGKDDERCIKVIVKKCFKEYNPIIFKYVNLKKDVVCNELQKHIKNNEPYVMLADKDDYSIEQRRSLQSKKFGIDQNHIVVIDHCIESWYIAGSEINYIEKSINNTEVIDKRTFNNLVGGKRNHILMMVEILKTFDTQKARKQSKSFKEFYQNFKRIIEN